MALGLSSSAPSPSGEGGVGVGGEGVALALCSLASRLFDVGKGKACDRVLELASNLFRNPSSERGALWRECAIRVAFLRALRRTDWVGATRLVSEASAVQRWASREEGDAAGLAASKKKDGENGQEFLTY